MVINCAWIYQSKPYAGWQERNRRTDQDKQTDGKNGRIFWQIFLIDTFLLLSLVHFLNSTGGRMPSLRYLFLIYFYSRSAS